MKHSVGRRTFLTSTFAAPLIRGAGSKPNVLIFMTDQESAITPGPYDVQPGSRWRSGERALLRRFATLHSARPHVPVCLPGFSRTELVCRPTWIRRHWGAPLAVVATVGTVFRDAGYRTGYFGKWHLGDERGPLTKFGFDTYERGKDEVVAKAAAEWIRSQTQPWLAWVSVLNPHDIYEIVKNLKSVPVRDGVQAPATTSADLANKPKPQTRYLQEDQGRPTVQYTSADWIRYRSYYCDLIEKADKCLTNVLDSVKEPQQTIVVYTSDHGDALGEHGLPFKGPFFYEPLIRIPLVIAGPGVRGGTSREEFATSADIAPTVASLAGLKWPGQIDGIDLFSDHNRDAVLLEYYGKQRWVEPIRAVRTKRGSCAAMRQANASSMTWNAIPRRLTT